MINTNFPTSIVIFLVSCMIYLFTDLLSAKQKSCFNCDKSREGKGAIILHFLVWKRGFLKANGNGYVVRGVTVIVTAFVTQF